jgi:glucose-1-phosphate adenylyltransferase
VAPDGRVLSFVEKPPDPWRHAEGGNCTINLGVYCFDPRFLQSRLREDARGDGTHDFGKDVLPRSLETGVVFSCPLERVSPGLQPYWRDVGTIASFFQAHLDLLALPPAFDLCDPRWPEESPFNGWLPANLPASASVDGRAVFGRNLVAEGAVLESANVVNSVLSPGAWVEPGAFLEECLLFPGARVKKGARLRRVIVEEDVQVPEATVLRVGTASSPAVLTVEGGGPHAGQDLRQQPLAGGLACRFRDAGPVRPHEAVS